MLKAFSSFSSQFVSPLFPGKGEETVFSIVFSERPESVLLRADSDSGTEWSYPMKESGTLNGAFRYSASAPVTSSDELFCYYFAFIYHGKSWYFSKKGITRSTPRRKDRFSLIPSLSAPAWVASSTCYQIFPDRFCSGNPGVGAKEGEYEFDGGVVSVHSFDEKPQPFSIARCLDFYNGDLKGIEDKIGYLKDLGIDTLYLNPVNASMTVHRYDAVDFFHVDEKLGGDEALISLIDKLHENGMRIIVDISINHTGIENPWFRKALEDRGAEEAGFYVFENGEPCYWQGVRTLAQLNYSSGKLRDLIYRDHDSVLQRFIRPPFSQDGWRLDVAPEVGRSKDSQLTAGIWREVRNSLKAIRPDLYLVGEDWDDSSEYLQGDMWDGTMNYYGAGRAIRSWMGERDRFLTPGWGHDPEREAPWSGYEMADAIMDGVSSVPDQIAFFQMNLIDSHDTPRLHNNKAVMNKDLYFGCLMVLFMLPGMPSVYYGDEIGLEGEMGSVEGARYPMCWDESKWDKEIKAMYSQLSRIRKLPFLAYSAFTAEAIDNDAFSIKRIGRDEALVAVVNRCPRRRSLSLDGFALPLGRVSIAAGKGSARICGGRIEVEAEAMQSILLYLTASDAVEKAY